MRFSHFVLVLTGVLLAMASHAAAMTFERAIGLDVCAARDCILAYGDVEADSARALKHFLRENRIAPGGLLILNSGGGDLLASLIMGTTVREAGLSTLVQAVDPVTRRVHGGQCASACVYILLGGVERGVGQGARVGVHQVAANGDPAALSASDSQWLMSIVAAHVSRMGANLNLLVPTLRTRPSEVYWLSTRELVLNGVVTPARAEIASAPRPARRSS